jgi:hypothetical protein
VAKPKRSRGKVFLNIPYDEKFERLFVAYIAGLSALGLRPHATLEIPDSTRRLEKILRIERSCEYSVHDLSRVELSPRKRGKPRVPRFNMPFELGLCVADATHAGTRKPNWFVFETVDMRADKSLSDLKGTDPKIHGGRITGVFGELRDVFRRRGRQATVQQMSRVYRELRKRQQGILDESGADSLFKPSVFLDLCVVARSLVNEIVVKAGG